MWNLRGVPGHFGCTVGHVSASIYPLHSPFQYVTPRSLDPHMAVLNHSHAAPSLVISSPEYVPRSRHPSVLLYLSINPFSDEYVKTYSAKIDRERLEVVRVVS